MIDHAYLEVADPRMAAERLREEHHLTAVPTRGVAGMLGVSGRDQDLIVPLGDRSYLQLRPEPRFDASSESDPRKITRLGWAILVPSAHEVGQRLGLEPATLFNVKQLTDGVQRSATPDYFIVGMEESRSNPYFPFFVERIPEAQHPGSQITQPGGKARISRIDLGCESDPALLDWVGTSDYFEVRFTGYSERLVTGVLIESSAGSVEISLDSLPSQSNLIN